jgi:superfamily II DNA or RNA helicase/HKD family nuclease
MHELNPGLYEDLITEVLSHRLDAVLDGGPVTTALTNAEAADRLAMHVARVVERAVATLPDEDRAAVGTQIARRLVELIADEPQRAALLDESPIDPGRVLRAIRTAGPDGRIRDVDQPLIPLLDTTLLTNSPGEPRVGHQILAEIASADRIDVIMAFIRRTGIAPLREHLRKHVEAGKQLRVLTTIYTGSTEALALDWLHELGAQVRVSYDTGTTRLHAKAWLFHRDSGFSTAYVGSSNLTHSAQVSGLEWNVRVSGARNRAVIDKIAAVFESYWQQADFVPYDPEQFQDATRRQRTDPGLLLLSPVEIRLEPFQERLLEQIELSRHQGRDRNLLVSATGTGKTVMAAVDYARLRTSLPRARLLFVAHREEILAQSRATFAHALRDGSFGEMWVGGKRPTEFEHVFASIQSITANGVEELDPHHFDVVIIDEFHHAAAATYDRLLEHLQPAQLLGLTATPERSDGLPLLHWFDGHIAAELRLWDAIDQHRLTPFAYYGIADELDMREVPWRRGTGYDVEGLTNLITSTDVWARKVLAEFERQVGDADRARALGFCVSVAHARYMARVFNQHGVASVAVWADTPDAERKQALTDLAAGRVKVVFSVDLFNEGVDVPVIDTLLMLRPTDSGLLFLQQLGRGLRRSQGKTLCTVLDFVGQHRKEFRYDRRFRALLGGSRKSLERQVDSGFPFLPAGCHMELDRVARDRVLDSIRRSVPSRWPDKVAELRSLAAEHPELTLSQFLNESGLELDDVYSGNRSWSDLQQDARTTLAASGPHERILRRACGRLLHVDDADRLETWSRYLQGELPPDPDQMSDWERRLVRMLVAQLVDQVRESDLTLKDGIELVWEHPQIRAELLQLFDVLSGQVSHVGRELEVLPDVPLRIHARYTRLEILAAAGVGTGAQVMTWQTGVQYVEHLPADLFAFTLDKTKGQFSPTTRYRDYALSRELIHWESQSVTREDSDTGMRYQQHAPLGSHVLLFTRLNVDERAFYFLGPATYVNHVGELPMAVTWQLHHPLPGDLFQQFAAAVA